MRALSWLGTLLQVAGALCLAAQATVPFWAYVIMTPGAALWLCIAARRRDWPLASLHATFVVINLIGIARW